MPRDGSVWSLAFGAWLVATTAALAVMDEYASRTGEAARAPATWPAESHLPRIGDRPTLVMVAHTRCACTRASLHELERLMTRAGDSMSAVVVFVGPRDIAPLLDVRATARAIPNVSVVEDENEARLFGAATSGQVLLYDEPGRLVFHGGITPSRGHEGASVGGDAVRHFLATRDGQPRVSDVFGCALFDARTQ